MCAIFGSIGTSNLNLIKKISEKQIYRGPDEQNFYVSDDNLVSMGNNRLSVIDKEKGKARNRKSGESTAKSPILERLHVAPATGAARRAGVPKVPGSSAPAQ